jgi:hypothetical protein
LIDAKAKEFMVLFVFPGWAWFAQALIFAFF